MAGMSAMSGMSAIDLTRYAARGGSVLADLGIRDTNRFNTIIEQSIHRLNRTLPDGVGPSAQQVGAILLQEMISKKLKKQIGTLDPVRRAELAPRLKYFKSSDFIDNFLTVLPTRDTWGQSPNHKSSSYTVWLNALFKTNFKEWRGELLTSADNQSQCKAALGIAQSTSVVDLQGSGTIQCYLCGNRIRAAPPTMECEHILPIVSALAHVWLVQRPIDPVAARALQDEYDWSHECCNQIKSSYDLIKYSPNVNRYIHNDLVIRRLLTEIGSSTGYDCRTITLAINNYGAVKDKLNPLLAIINRTLDAVGDNDMYILLTKYKLLSALTSDNFLSILLGQDPTGELVAVQTRPIYNPAARAAAKARRQAFEQELAADEAAIREARAAGSARRAAMMGRQQGGDDYNPEDVEFPSSFIDIVTRFSASHGIPVLPIEQLIPLYILFNPEFSPTSAEASEVVDDMIQTYEQETQVRTPPREVTGPSERGRTHMVTVPKYRPGHRNRSRSHPRHMRSPHRPTQYGHGYKTKKTRRRYRKNA